MEDRRDCRMRMRRRSDDQHLLQCSLTYTNCERDDLFKEPTDEVIKLIQYWLKKGI